MARVYGVSSHTSTAVAHDWRFAKAASTLANAPSELPALTLGWRPALVPGTVASAERALKAWSFASPCNYDADDWWYSAELTFVPLRTGERRTLLFEGLASLADAWIDEHHVLTSDNMFVAHELDVSAFAPGSRQLVIRFRSLDAALKSKKPRPRWRTRLVPAQNLRAFRTTLIGRVPAFTPPVAAVGPYRPVTLTTESRLSVREADLRTALSGSSGVVSASFVVHALDGARVLGARLRVGEAESALSCAVEPAVGAQAGGAAAPCTLDGAGMVRVSGRLELPHVPLWWPHTHGAQPRIPAALEVALESGVVTIDLGLLAFRALELDTEDGAFGLRINGVPVFCRGACWTTSDVVTLGGDEPAYRTSLQLARDAGMNMLRIAGTNAYETDVFYELCDELGILVWQDFMFANMDYPSDEAFVASVRREVAHFVSRTQTRACLAVLCGGSEVEQQVAMLGLPRELWDIPLFRQHIPSVCHRLRPDVPYCSSSPTGGALPFHVNRGVGHYYGVGAYLRPLEDARRAEVRFASECLAFANIPEEATLETFIGGGVATPQNVRWKERAPRDSGGSWDFDDVRDHYLERLFGVGARELRTTDLERYLALGRVVTGEVMAHVFGEWRRARSTCRGGLVFAYQDFWPGAGFGVVDSLGRPKAAFYYLKRALATVALFASDEGSNGVVMHAVNDSAEAIEAQLVVELYRHGQVLVTRFEREWTLAARSAAERSLDQELDHFVDSAYSYRFGPPVYDVLVARLTRRGAVATAAPGATLGEAYFFPTGMALPRHVDIGLHGVACKQSDGSYELTVTTTRFAQAVCVDAPAYLADDNWFHLAPGSARTLRLRAARPGAGAPLSATLQALNAYGSARVTLGVA